MRVVCVGRDNSEYARSVEGWIHGFTRMTGRDVEMIDPDGRDGVEFCRVYDVVEYPTIMVLAEDGGVRGMWRGKELPLYNEVLGSVVE